MTRIYKNILILALILLSISLPERALAGADEILDVLENLTCETDGVGELLSSEFSHTCLPSTLMTHVVANIISPALFAQTLLKLKLNDPDITNVADNCERENRAILSDLKLKFSVCSNNKLFLKRAEGVGNATVAIFASFISCFSGSCTDPWDDIKDTFNIPKEDYHDDYEEKIDSQGTIFDAGLVPVMPWKIIRIGDRLCFATFSLGGWIPVGCKYIKEPHEDSIYADFFSLTSPPANTADLVKLTTCSGMQSCYATTHNNSRNGVVVSAMIVECVKTMVAKMLVNKDVCNIDQVSTSLATTHQSNSVLYKFQMNMRLTVSALLTLYVIFFGFRVILAGDLLPKAEMFNFIFKIIFVMYFTVGLNASDGTRFDGMTELAIPFLLGGMTELVSWILDSSANGLCYFAPSDYNAGYSFLSVWDSLDCRVSHYLGLDMAQAMAANYATKVDTGNPLDSLSFPIPAYLYLLIPAIYSGNFFFVTLALLYPILVLSLGAFIVGATAVCIIAVAILAILSPVFVPMILFNYTRTYFDGWVRVLLACMLQPMVAAAFLMTMMTVYDAAYYGKCKFNNKVITDDGRPVMVYFLDQDWANYNKDEISGCQDSLGYMLTNPFGYIYNTGVNITESENYPQVNDVKNVPDAIEFVPKLFITGVTTIFEKLKTMMIAMLNACFVIYLMYHFSKSLTGFVVDMTQGAAPTGMTIAPTKIFDTAKPVLGGINFKRSDGGGGGSKGAMDKVATK